MTEDDDLLEHLRRQADQNRKHASFFSWYDRSPSGKGIAENGILRTLLEAMESIGKHAYSNPRPSEESWPDCLADSENGNTVAFEVTELVDESALPAGEARPWSTEMVRDRLTTIIKTKDGKSFGRGEYQEVVLLIHTDELYLDADELKEFLSQETFSLPHGNLSRAFLLFSYQPNRNGYPFVELRLAS